jgi:hypothetical protein
MPDETTAVISGAPQPVVEAPIVAVPQPMVSTPEISESVIRDMVRNEPRSQKTREAVKQFRDRVFKAPKEVKSVEAAPVAVAPVVSTPIGESPTMPAPKLETPKYEIQSGADKLALRDPDGFLGHKDAEGMKKALANKELYVNRLSKWNEQNEARARSEAKRAVELERKVKELEARVSQPATPVAVTPVAHIALKELPKMPERFEDEDAAVKYQRDYAAIVQENMTTLANRTQSSPNINPQDPALQAIQSELQSLKALRQDIENQKATQERTSTESRIWDNIQSFQSLHGDEFSTQTPIRELHTKIVGDGQQPALMDRIAVANGLQRPITDNEQEWINYNSQKNEITDKYLAGDEAVKTNVESAGIVLPQGFSEYFDVSAKINRLVQEHQRLISEQTLGPKSTLHDAWRYIYEPALTQQTVAMERAARAEGAKAVVSALKDHSETHAVNVPPAQSESGILPEALRGEAERILAAARENPRDKKTQQELKELRKKLGFVTNQRAILT